MNAAVEASAAVPVASLCRGLGISRATLYRRKHPKSPVAQSRERGASIKALSPPERQTVLDLLHEERFLDQAPAEVYATLLDEGIYHCSVRGMYRILEAHQEVRERRDQAQRTSYTKPEPQATGPNQVWTWDITKRLGPVKWTYFYLYVVLDIYSRYAVGWLLAPRESAALAQRLLEETCTRHGIPPGQLSIHADRGSSMRSQPVALLLSDLGVTQSHSRPRVSNDNPFSESQFKTLKYRPEFPERFGSIEEARAFGKKFFAWYNREHHHSGIGWMTPYTVHYGQAPKVTEARQRVLDSAYEQHPERFIRKKPTAPELPQEVWINPPPQTIIATQDL